MPRISIIGFQGSGKSALINRFIGHTILPSYAQGNSVTKVPISITCSAECKNTDDVEYEIELHETDYIRSKILEVITLPSDSDITTKSFQKCYYYICQYIKKGYLEESEFNSKDTKDRNNRDQDANKIVYEKHTLNIEELRDRIEAKKLQFKKEKQVVKLEEFRRFLTTLKDQELIKEIKVCCSCDYVESEWVIIDTPGFDYLNELDQYKNNDVTILVGSVDRILEQVENCALEKVFLDALLSEYSSNKLIFVITKLDISTRSDIIEIVDRMSSEQRQGDFKLTYEDIITKKKEHVKEVLQKMLAEISNSYYLSAIKPKLQQDVKIFCIEKEDSPTNGTDEFQQLYETIADFISKIQEISTTTTESVDISEITNQVEQLSVNDKAIAEEFLEAADRILKTYQGFNYQTLRCLVFNNFVFTSRGANGRIDFWGSLYSEVKMKHSKNTGLRQTIVSIYEECARMNTENLSGSNKEGVLKYMKRIIPDAIKAVVKE
jgi:GTPase SAR1 family protein